MTPAPAQDQKPPAHVGIFQIFNGAHVAGAVACLAQLGIPDLVESGPRSPEDLAKQIGADPRALKSAAITKQFGNASYVAKLFPPLGAHPKEPRSRRLVSSCLTYSSGLDEDGEE